MKNLIKSIINKLFKISEKELILDISNWFSEAIKSNLRKSGRCELNKQQIVNQVRNEFNLVLNNDQLMKLLAYTRALLRNYKITLYADAAGVIAGKQILKLAIA